MATLTGSSPHTRGAHGGGGWRRPGLRIIPAYAGSTEREMGGCESKTDHPRIRGEHGVRRHQGVIDGGSSPHTRGAPGTGRSGLGRRRIIPAYAGSTHDYVGQVQLGGDHPRIRGEHCTRIVRRPRWIGSSPHTRGAPDFDLEAIVDDRIIPAYAGSTLRLLPGLRFSADHPRIRGEHVR